MTTATRKRMTREGRRAVIESAATEVFAERGFRAASMDEIARRAGVSVPVLYDHFASKLGLHVDLLERHYADLRAVWAEHLLTDEPAEVRIPRAFDAWFAYIESHPYAGRLLFLDTTGDPAIAALHRRVQVESRAAAVPLLAREPGAEHLAGSGDTESIEMAWEAIRGVLQSLALWWYEHPDVPRHRVVATAMNTIWVGFERARRGERWDA